jgi:hypothetical protein
MRTPHFADNSPAPISKTRARYPPFRLKSLPDALAAELSEIRLIQPKTGPESMPTTPGLAAAD